MTDTGADRFLNCVMERNEYDTVMPVIVLALVSIGTPAYYAYSMIKYQIETEYIFTPDFYYIHVLFMSMIGVFLMYIIVRSLRNHHRRDLEWMDSLTDYARHEGKDVRELETIRALASTLTKESYTRYALWIATVIVVLNLTQVAIYTMVWPYDDKIMSA